MEKLGSMSLVLQPAEAFNMNMKIAIIGSREFKQMNLVEETLFYRLPYFNTEVITGGAKGIDTYVEEYCKRKKIPCEVIIPINPKDKLSYLFRNVEIITKADKIIAFWDGKSKGTKFIIDYATARNKDIEIYQDNAKNK